MLQFEWDSEKAKRNIQIHKVSFDEASTIFKDTLSLTIYDHFILKRKTDLF